MLVPYIARDKKYLENERNLCEQLKLLCPSYFEKCRTHIDYLSIMQHYGLPTRLLDITSNPLVALYFAVRNTDNKDDGEIIVLDVPDDDIKFERSDKATILSCLPSLTYYEQLEIYKLINNKSSNFNVKSVVQKLLHEIKSEKPFFTNNINPCDLQRSIVVTPSMNNNRIIRQSGAFILCGLDNYTYNDKISYFDEKLESSLKYISLENYRYKKNNDEYILFIINNKDKSTILNELKMLGIHEAALFPELDHVANYLKNELM